MYQISYVLLTAVCFIWKLCNLAQSMVSKHILVSPVWNPVAKLDIALMDIDNKSELTRRFLNIVTL